MQRFFAIFGDFLTEMDVDVFADDQKTFEAVSFKEVTPYKEISDTGHMFRVRHTGKDAEQTNRRRFVTKSYLLFAGLLLIPVITLVVIQISDLSVINKLCNLRLN